MRLPPWSATLETKLGFMREHGSSVLLNWGEDDNLWECSWITGGDRYSGYSKFIDEAVRQCFEAARKALV